jgi:hypothetical protein
MEVEAIGSETLAREPEALVEQGGGEKCSLQVELASVEIAFDEEAASALEHDPRMSALERSERYSWQEFYVRCSLQRAMVRGIRS